MTIQPRPIRDMTLRRRVVPAVLALVPLLAFGVVACGPGDAEDAENPEDARGAVGAESPDAGALPDGPDTVSAAPRAGGSDSSGVVGGAGPGTPDRPVEGTPVGPDTLTGVVGTVGAEPLVQFVLQLDDGRVIPMGSADGTTRPEAVPEHPLAELARLTGATVRVMGEADAFAATPARGFAVEAYEILEVEGSRPFTGTLVRGDAGAGTPDRLEVDRDGSRILVGMPSGTPGTGARVWVVGAVRGDSLLVEGYGVLRPARP